MIRRPPRSTPLSLHDALPISRALAERLDRHQPGGAFFRGAASFIKVGAADPRIFAGQDRKSTRLNSSHANISYAVFCLKKKKKLLSLYPNTAHSYSTNMN